MAGKIIIYQLLPRLFGNTQEHTLFNGSLAENGCGKFRDVSNLALKELGNFGITHVWVTGIIRHATQTAYDACALPASHPDIVKGLAGSPYAINDYFDVDPDLALSTPNRMQEFDDLVERIHGNGMKVIIDFVPNHVARDYHSVHLPDGLENLGKSDNRDVSFSPGNNFYYHPGEPFRIRGLKSLSASQYHEFPAKSTGNDVFRPDPDISDWYETVKLNYGFDYAGNKGFFHPVPDTWIKMTEILLFWSAKGIDGFRCDMAGMVPVEFWEYAIRMVKTDYPDMLFIAELYEPHRYRNYLETGLFDYLYDKVGWYDAARRVICDNGSTREFTAAWQSLEGLDGQMVRFLENHDEQRIASPQFAGNPRKALPAFALAAFMHNGPVMVYSGQEVGEPAEGATGFSGNDGRTTIFDYAAMPELRKWFNNGRCDGGMLSAEQKKLRESYSRILRIAAGLPHFSSGSFYDLMWVNEDNPYRNRLFAFLRYGGTENEEAILVAAAMDKGINEISIRIPDHALNDAGFGTRQRFTLKGIIPVKDSETTLLTSQLTSTGIHIRLCEDGYAVLLIH